MNRYKITGSEYDLSRSRNDARGMRHAKRFMEVSSSVTRQYQVLDKQDLTGLLDIT